MVHFKNCIKSSIKNSIKNFYYLYSIGFIAFNIRLNNHRKDVKNPNVISACKHFNRRDNDFNNHGKIIITEQLRNIQTTSTETLKEKLKLRENVRIMKLETLAPPGLNQDLIWIHFIQTFRSLIYIYYSKYIINNLQTYTEDTNIKYKTRKIYLVL